tara:strand:- start:51145 stop:51648 length:504 start_codon:yes stop_codon:yes gene_type:complete
METVSYIDKLIARIAHRPIGVFIPRHSQSKTLKHLAQGSAIVSDASLLSGGLIEVYYEGNVIGASNLIEFEDKALCAVGRLIQRYPTVARSWVKPDSLLQVGHISVVKPIALPLPEPVCHLPVSIAKQLLPRELQDAVDPKPIAACVITEKNHPAFIRWVELNEAVS